VSIGEADLDLGLWKRDVTSDKSTSRYVRGGTVGGPWRRELCRGHRSK